MKFAKHSGRAAGATLNGFVAAAMLGGALLGPALCGPGASVARADERGAQMRGMVNRYGNSVVTVSVKLKLGQMQDQMELETQGLVVDDTGLVVIPNMSIDPMSALSEEMGGGSLSSSVVAAKYLMPGTGEEVPARLVLRDKDRNLAFLRPLKKETTFKPLNFKNSNATAQLADPVLLVGRLGKAGGRNASITEERLTAVLQKPRTMYGLSYMNIMHLGEAAFNEKGEFLGMVSVRMSRGRTSTRSMNPGDSMLAIVIPAADVWEVAAQAPSVAQSSAQDSRPTPKPAAPKPGATKPGAPKPGTTKPAQPKPAPAKPSNSGR